MTDINLPMFATETAAPRKPTKLVVKRNADASKRAAIKAAAASKRAKDKLIGRKGKLTATIDALTAKLAEKRQQLKDVDGQIKTLAKK